MCADSSEDHLQPFKEKMEEFVSAGKFRFLSLAKHDGNSNPHIDFFLFIYFVLKGLQCNNLLQLIICIQYVYIFPKIKL